MLNGLQQYRQLLFAFFSLKLKKGTQDIKRGPKFPKGSPKGNPLCNSGPHLGDTSVKRVLLSISYPRQKGAWERVLRDNQANATEECKLSLWPAGWVFWTKKHFFCAFPESKTRRGCVLLLSCPLLSLSLCVYYQAFTFTSCQLYCHYQVEYGWSGNKIPGIWIWSFNLCVSKPLFRHAGMAQINI